jgi:hypothetical protein
MRDASMNSYIHRFIAPYYAQRSLLLGVELTKACGPSMMDDAMKWMGRFLKIALLGADWTCASHGAHGVVLLMRGRGLAQ